MSDQNDSPEIYFSFGEAVEHLDQPVYHVGSAEGVLAPYNATPQDTAIAVRQAAERGFFDEA